MLSRVAAVKAPRTHNRRRATGSSGRRREGRESEPQRPNMSRDLFCSAFLLLLVVMMCCNTGGAAEAAEQPSEPRFGWKDANDGGVTVESLGVPGLLKVGSDVFAVAEAQCKKNSESDSFTGIASQLLPKQTANTPVEVLNEVKETQFLEEGTSEDSRKKVDVRRPTTVMQGNDIYMLVGKYSSADVGEKSGANDGGFFLVKGEVSDESGGGKRIKWSDNEDVSRASFGEQRQSWSRLIGGGGLGVYTDDGRLVFPVQGTKKKGEAQNDEKTVSLLIYTSSSTKSWTLSKGMSDGGCSAPSVVEWKDKKLIMMMTACDDGRRRVYESGDMGDSWTEALGTLSRVWGNKKGAKTVRSGFITATVDGVEGNRNVMLVTLPVYSEKLEKGDNGKEKSELHLWLTDNTHIVDIGPVSGKDDDVAASSLLYKSAESGDNGEKLIVLYEKKKGDEESSHSLWSVLLTEQLQRVKDVLATWKKVDDLVSKLCTTSSAVESTPSENACSPTVKITAGLVGFLSDNFSENKWRDEYLGVNATVKNNDDEGKKATLHEGSVKFQGAWAEWPVGEQGENQLYHFANYNFTLVATVSIEGEPTEEGDTHIPLMGVKMNGDENTENSVLLGLSYNKKKKWILLCGGKNPEEHSNTWEKDTTHQVVLMLQNGTQGSAYVDGQRVGGGEACALENKDSKEISHFYIGGDGGAKGVSEIQDVSVTVSNVLLYNRPLDDDEITALNTKLSIPKASEAKTVKKGTPSPEAIKPATLETRTPSSLGGQQQTEQDPLRTSENAGSGSLSTSAVSSATTSPAAKESEDQSASGTPPEGHSNVDGASSSEGVQTVDAETGDTVQGDRTHQPSVGTPATADTNAPTAEIMAHDGAADTTEVGVHSGENEETVGGTDGQKREDIHAQDGEVKAAALSSSLGNVSQGNNSDAGTVRGSGLLPLFLLLGLWVFAAL
ncbi:putative trans-sialidase, Group VI [Trypanosoma cruzi]|uniref:Trans-sialidase, putative n=2 Tax=Trypanosoma cruzi TaxID=5693 RepID=Q4DD87_TRYCC|nr:trans-sialidase, putative [Trypanosoma cruzi]EAN90488.1 trans-sialidase, putative [Trypanosoma cruzi]PWU93147.1 putative trans-sialidase, Group VI [Trypanosoma cruzi]RNC36837.1 putative trans-sialidase [Trypanosoma cruzi]|eukprot:XP_812339.1 trans-sialidase [Trypanosoma cruzi strain CL Brener]